ncbi:N-acetylated-alpha-linked acidic dipeptidase 2 [Folsomia candida]|uniref:N-acetylated-alpha-linked acidic dipeptidase 2 n=1 Tax=Folsomia candida TaxID=158441 RepID=A0A226EJ23_FOLCA|nr:N-acetylated-alpha-linked acidic dipeptidase 2 [Folsomia candida]
MMGGRRDYSRWDYDDETEITMEEQLTLEDNGSMGGSTESQATFPPTSHVLTSNSPIRSRLRDGCKRSRKTSIKEKAQLFVLSAGVLFVGFLAGFGFGVRDRETPAVSRHSKHLSSISDPLSVSSHEHDLIFHELLQQISAHNIRDNLKTVTKDEHRAGTKEGHQMATVIRDLWRSFGISVRLEQHKTLLTKSETSNYAEVIGENGTVLFTTSKIGDDVNLPNSRPIVAFSPPSDSNGTGQLVFGNYGRLEDFQRLRKSQLALKGSIALIRFGTIHPSAVASNAIAFGCRGLVFYPDPQDFGPKLPIQAIRSTSLLTVGQVHDYQKHKGNWSIPSLTISGKDAEKLFAAMEGTEKAPKEWIGGLNATYYIGGGRKPDGGGLVRLKIVNFNEAKTSTIYNVVAAIPGSIESDRYVIIGSSHDGPGAGDPGIGLAITTELLKAFSNSLTAGWRPRRSILFISWDANLFAASGALHWLQEHHFEIATRAVAYIDMTRTLKGNQTLEVFSSPLLKEVAHKAINKIKRASASPTPLQPTEKLPQGLENVQWKAVVTSDEPSFAFLNLGVPFIRLAFSNAPKEIRKEFDHFMAEYNEDFHRGSIQISQLQAAVMRLEVTADNFRLQSKNHTSDSTLGSHHRKLRREMQNRILNDKLISVEKACLTRNSDVNDGYKHQIIGHASSNMAPEIPLYVKTVTDVESKLQQQKSHMVDKSNTTVAVHPAPARTTTSGKNNFHSRRVFSTEHFPSVPRFFPKVRAVLECGRNCDAGLNSGDACTDSYLFATSSQPGVSLAGESNNSTAISKSSSSCLDWSSVAAQRISSLVRSLDSVSSIIQSPLVTQLPHDE